MTKKTYDFAVVGAGVFGAWTAHFLRRSGMSVALLDAYGPANSRAKMGLEITCARRWKVAFAAGKRSPNSQEFGAVAWHDLG